MLRNSKNLLGRNKLLDLNKRLNVRKYFNKNKIKKDIKEFV